MGTRDQVTARAGGHERFYRSLLRIYPADYRASYGDDMVQLFGDQLRDARNGRSTASSIRVWARALGDLATTAASEHVRRNRTVAQSLVVAPTPVSRILGVLGVIGGAVLLAAFVVEISPDVMNLRLVLFNLGAIAVVLAVHTRQSAAGPRLALLGAVPAILTNAAYLILIVRLAAQPGELGPGDYGPLIFYVSGAMWLSDLWFGLVTFRLGVPSRASSIALIVGSVAAFLGMSVFGLAPAGSLMEKIILSGIALHGVAWILLGLEVALGRRPSLVRER